jgi:hypothetical protein
MNRRRRSRDGGSNLRWRTEALFQRQLRADYRASRGPDDKIRSPKIDSLTSETIHQTNFPSPTHGAAGTKHECPQTVTSSAVRAAVIYHCAAPSFRTAAWKCSSQLPCAASTPPQSERRRILYRTAIDNDTPITAILRKLQPPSESW